MVPAAEAEPVKLRFSEVVRLLRERRVEMDCDGLLVAADASSCLSFCEAAGCPMTKLEMVFRLAGGAVPALVHGAIDGNPGAWEALARWYAEGEMVDRLDALRDMLAAEGDGCRSCD